jgi:very-short-patch-repair endonuclease
LRKEEERSQPFARALRKRMTKAEVVLWKALKEANRHGYNFRRQHPIGPYIADFASALDRLVIEVDGWTHGSDMEVRHDARRDAYLRTRGWQVIRVSNDDIYAGVERIVEIILARLPPPARAKSRASSPVNGGG